MNDRFSASSLVIAAQVKNDMIWLYFHDSTDRRLAGVSGFFGDGWLLQLEQLCISASESLAKGIETDQITLRHPDAWVGCNTQSIGGRIGAFVLAIDPRDQRKRGIAGFLTKAEIESLAAFFATQRTRLANAAPPAHERHIEKEAESETATPQPVQLQSTGQEPRFTVGAFAGKVPSDASVPANILFDIGFNYASPLFANVTSEFRTSCREELSRRMARIETIASAAKMPMTEVALFAKGRFGVKSLWELSPSELEYLFSSIRHQPTIG